MKLFKILIYILLIPAFVFFALFFEYLSFFSLFLVFSVFLFKDLKNLNLIWFLIFVSVFLDVSMHYWIGTYFASIVIAFLFLIAFEKLINNFFLDIVVVVLAFIIFRISFQIFIFFQETSMFLSLDLELFYDVVFFSIKNLFIYLVLKMADYFLRSYFRGNTFNER